MALDLTCGRVLDTGVGVVLPREDGGLSVCTGFGFLLVPFDATLVWGAAFVSFDKRGRAGDWSWHLGDRAALGLRVDLTGKGLAIGNGTSTATVD